MANVGKVKFQPPNVPVIFILGGPGSGKVTHCGEIEMIKSCCDILFTDFDSSQIH